jgi:hypothetical protein
MEPWDGFGGGKSCRYYSWLNRLAAELETTHLDRMVGCLAYRMMNDPLQFCVFPPDVEELIEADADLSEVASAMRHMGTLRATCRDRWRCVIRSGDEARR